MSPPYYVCRLRQQEGNYILDLENKNPFDIFDQWMTDAIRDEPNNPNAMCLSTVSTDGKPSSRMVLLKDYGQNGFIFFTNSHSRKGQELEGNNNVALCLYWKKFQRQVRIEGTVEIVSRDITEAYFHSRHRGSQIASYASKQSHPLPDKSIYTARIAELENKFKGQDNIPCPEHWNGYRVMPSSIELWQEGEHRTHDRFVFRADEDNWKAKRLYP